MSSTSEWKYIGTQGVDSGGVIITDPCYIKHWNEVGDDLDFDVLQGRKETDEFGFHGYCSQTLKGFGGELKNDIGATLGVVARSGIGDGGYNVYIKTDNLKGWGERVIEMKIVFIEPEEVE